MPTVGWALLTDARMIYHGISKRQNQTLDCRLLDIDSVEAIGQRGYGRVAATLAGRPFVIETFDGPPAQLFAAQVREEVEAAKERAPQNIQTARAATPSLAQEISKLADLRSNGTLSEAEFAIAKDRLLSG